MSEQSLTSKTKYGLIWSSVERFGTQGIQFLFSVILARILSPTEYGIIAMPMVFLALAQCFIDSGFSSALIRKTDIKDEDYSTTFIFSIIVGVFCYVVLFFASPLIAYFYDTPILSDILKFTALVVLINPLCIVQQTILTKRIDFKTQTCISMIGAILSGIVGLWMAYNGYGIWSLVAQQVGAAGIRMVLFWILVKWNISLKWSRESFNYLWGFGSKLLGVSIINTTFNNIFTLIIGKTYTPQDLGNYTRAQQFSDLPSVNLTGVLQRVTFPVLSTIQDDNERLACSYRKILRLTAYCIFPFMVGLASVADSFITTLLGEKWIGCIIFVQLLCFERMLYPIHAINLNLLTVKGRSDLFLKLEYIKKGIGIAILCVTIPFGILYMVGGAILSSYLCLIVNTYYTGKMINCGFIIQMKDMLPSLLLSFSMYILIRIMRLFIDNDILHLTISIIIGGLFYVVVSYILKLSEFKYLKDIIKKK